MFPMVLKFKCCAKARNRRISTPMFDSAGLLEIGVWALPEQEQKDQSTVLLTALVLGQQRQNQLKKGGGDEKETNCVARYSRTFVFLTYDTSLATTEIQDKQS